MYQKDMFWPHLLSKSKNYRMCMHTIYLNIISTCRQTFIANNCQLCACNITTAAVSGCNRQEDSVLGLVFLVSVLSLLVRKIVASNHGGMAWRHRRRAVIEKPAIVLAGRITLSFCPSAYTYSQYGWPFLYQLRRASPVLSMP